MIPSRFETLRSQETFRNRTRVTIGVSGGESSTRTIEDRRTADPSARSWMAGVTALRHAEGTHRKGDPCRDRWLTSGSPRFAPRCWPRCWPSTRLRSRCRQRRVAAVRRRAARLPRRRRRTRRRHPRRGPPGGLRTAVEPAAAADPHRGRETEGADLRAYLEDTGQPFRIANLHGVAGIGKTALAVHTAHLAAPKFEAGELFARFLPEPAPRDAVDAIRRRFIAALSPTGTTIPRQRWRQIVAYRRWSGGCTRTTSC